MGHHITGIIGQSDALRKLQGTLAAQPRFALAEGFAFMPLDYENLDEITGLNTEDAIPEFVYLTPRLIELLRLASIDGEFSYIETEYHGGNGGQGAVLFRQGEVAFGPLWVDENIGPINETLTRMGVSQKQEKLDAFDVVGLDALRSNEDFRGRGTAA